MLVAAIQPDTDWEDPDANFARLWPMLEKAAAAGARLALLPEMFSTGFSMATETVAEAPDGASESFVREAAATLGLYVGGSCPIRPPGAARPYNRFVVYGPGGDHASYDKIHPFGFGGESEHYASGASGLTLEIEGVRCTVFICYDLRFADRFWEAARTTDCYLVPANWPAARAEHWRTLLRARAIENLAYVVGVNRVGVGDGLAYAGGSLVVGPFGEVLAEAGETEEVLVAEIEPERVAATRARYPVLEDR